VADCASLVALYVPTTYVLSSVWAIFYNPHLPPTRGICASKPNCITYHLCLVHADLNQQLPSDQNVTHPQSCGLSAVVPALGSMAIVMSLANRSYKWHAEVPLGVYPPGALPFQICPPMCVKQRIYHLYLSSLRMPTLSLWSHFAYATKFGS
jgi:hypothetical protein